MERSPSRARTCLARARRERGQKRVPLPPAKITGRKSIAFNIEETSYRTKITFAQGGTNYFHAKIPHTGGACPGCGMQCTARVISRRSWDECERPVPRNEDRFLGVRCGDRRVSGRP